MGAVWRMARSLRRGWHHIRCDEQFTFPPLPCDRHPSPVTRCQLCHRTVAYRPGNLSEVLTGHHRRAHPGTLGLRSR
jgi:hypothetical protein